MSSLLNRIAAAVRALAYKSYRAHRLNSWFFTLNDTELEYEVDRWYYSVKGEHLDFKHPQSFSEKLQWLKVHDKDPRKTEYSDKLAVRSYVEKTVGQEVLPQVYRIWDTAQEIDFTGLTEPFFLKCNNGSGYMMRIANPQDTNLAEARTNAERWLSADFATRYFEMHYAGITPRVYAEQWLDDIEWEYQAWCFSGKLEFIAAIRDPHGINKKQFFSPTWEKLPFISSPPEYQGTIAQPDCLAQLVEWSERLANDFCFVRVDWYGTAKGLMFSEMSFTPAYGIVHWVPASYNQKVGELITLPIED